MTDIPWNLVDVMFCDPDPAAVEREVIAVYELITGLSLAQGSPERLFCEAMAYMIALQRAVIDDSAKMNLLAYARGDYLDHLGALTDTARLTATAAATTVRFSIADALGFVVTIPAGTRVTPDGSLYFATDATAEIAVGETYVDVAATCQASGAAGNGLVPGQVNKLVDPLAYVTTVSNTTVSLGGSDAEADDNYRGRIHLSPEKYSVAGPGGAYQYWAKSAHQDIADVSVRSPARWRSGRS